VYFHAAKAAQKPRFSFQFLAPLAGVCGIIRPAISAPDGKTFHRTVLYFNRLRVALTDALAYPAL
jgi:hypothetical protein